MKESLCGSQVVYWGPKKAAATGASRPAAATNPEAVDPSLV
jgi:hypothetical protein